MVSEESTSRSKRVLLRDCCFRPEYGYTASASEKPVGPKFLRITDIQDGKVDWTKVPHVQRPQEGHRNYFLEGGDIVIARIGATTGKAYLIQECPEAVFASYLIRLRTKPGLLPTFLNYCLQTSEYWQQINSQKGGRLKGGVSIPILQNLEIPLPTPVEQDAIVQVLNAVEEAKETRQGELVLERERKAALMEYLFTHGTRSEPRKQTAIGEIPDSWSVSRLGDCVSVDDRRRVPLSEKERQGRRGEFPYCGANGVLDYIDDYLFDGEFVLLAEDGGYWGAFESSAYVMRGRFWVNNHAHILQVKAGVANSLFLASLLNFLNLAPFIGGTTRGKLTQGVMVEIPVPLPHLQEQEQIATILSSCDKKISALEKENNLLDELFRALLEELMTGQLSAAPLIEEGETQ